MLKHLPNRLQYKMTSANYSFSLEGRKKEFERLLHREDWLLCFPELSTELEQLEWIGEVDYSGHFGYQIIVEGVKEPTPARLSQIEEIIEKHLAMPGLPARVDLGQLSRAICLHLLAANPRLHEPIPDRSEWPRAELEAELWAELSRWDNPGLIQGTWKELGWGDAR